MELAMEEIGLEIKQETCQDLGLEQRFSRCAPRTPPPGDWNYLKCEKIGSDSQTMLGKAE